MYFMYEVYALSLSCVDLTCYEAHTMCEEKITRSQDPKRGYLLSFTQLNNTLEWGFNFQLSSKSMGVILPKKKKKEKEKRKECDSIQNYLVGVLCL